MSGRFRYRRSLASRVIVLTTLAVGFSVAVVALAAYLFVRHELRTSADATLHQRALLTAQYDVSQYTLGAIPRFLQLPTDLEVGYIYADGSGRMISGADQVPVRPGRPEQAVAQGTVQYSCRTITTNGESFRVAAAPAQDDSAVVVAQPMASIDNTLDRLGLVLLIFGAVGVIAAALAGWGVARNGLRPVRRLTHAAEYVARTERLDPIEVEGNDEIARLASAFNAMLLALSASRDRQRQLVADAGHELRTPLTSLRTNLDLLTQADRQGGLSAASRAELLDDVQFQIAELTTLIGDLTELAREHPTAVMLVEVDFAEVIERAVERVRRRASSLQFELEVRPWWVIGDPAALERAVTNLLDNAAKWSPPLGVVGIRLREGTLTVTDQGRGIPEADLLHVFDRFYRSPESRTMAGSGLGLSIVRQVVERHGGLVRAGRAPGGGALLEVSLPGAASIGVADQPGEPEVTESSQPHSQWRLSRSGHAGAVTEWTPPGRDDDEETRRLPVQGQQHRYAEPGPAEPSGHDRPAWPDATSAGRRQPDERERRGRGLGTGLVVALLAAALVVGGLAGLVSAAGFGLVHDDSSGTTSPGVSQPVTSSSGPSSAIDKDSPAQESVQQVAAAVLPSVVKINVANSQEQGSGSGIVISADGEILTNNHVASVAEQSGTMTVSFNDGTTKKAKIVGTDPVTDLTVIRAEDVSGLQPAAIGRSATLDVGENVVAIGSPYGLQATVTSGIVSALNRPVSVQSTDESQGSGQDSSPQPDSTTYPAIQTDAAINPGNSGGPLVNLQGAVVGINSSIRTASDSTSSGGSIGLGFAIPIANVWPIVEQLRQGETPTHAQMGVSVEDATEDGGLLTGAGVSSVTKGSAAAEAGVKKGEVVTKVDDEVITGSESLVATIRGHRPGDTVRITLVAGKDTRTVDVTLDSDSGGTSSPGR